MPTGIPVNVPLMPQYFKDAGYTTHAIGKWHLGHCHQNYTPTYRGFDSFYGFYLGSQVRQMEASQNDVQGVKGVCLNTKYLSGLLNETD